VTALELQIEEHFLSLMKSIYESSELTSYNGAYWMLSLIRHKAMVLELYSILHWRVSPEKLGKEKRK
jgi:hypothetical protein